MLGCLETTRLHVIFSLTFNYEKHPQSIDLKLNCMSFFIFNCPIPVTNLPLKSPLRRQHGAAWFTPSESYESRSGRDFSWGFRSKDVCPRVTIAGVKHQPKRLPGGQGLFCFHLHFLPITAGGEEKNSTRAGAWRQELKQSPGRGAP